MLIWIMIPAEVISTQEGIDQECLLTSCEYALAVRP